MRPGVSHVFHTWGIVPGHDTHTHFWHPFTRYLVYGTKHSKGGLMLVEEGYLGRPAGGKVVSNQNWTAKFATAGLILS